MNPFLPGVRTRSEPPAGARFPVKIGRCLGLLLALTGLARAQTAEVIHENFETVQAMDEWVSDNGIWEIGVPATNPVGPNKAHQGTNCAGTVLAGFYPDGQNSRLISPAFVLPAGGLNPRLRFWHWYSFSGTTGGGRVQIKVGSKDWVSVSPEYAQNGGGVWTRPLIDLSAYIGKRVQLAFYFTAPPAGGFVDAGWYVDEVTVETGPYVWDNPETWEGGLGDWQVDSGTWEIGVPVTNPVGPNQAHQGTNCAGTVLAGYYPDGQESRLISPSFVVPVAQLNPRLRFWHWYSFAGITVGGRVEIREGAGDWVSISPGYWQNGGDVWTRPLIDLSAYAGKTVQLAFHFTAPAAGGFIDAGWYVDEVTVETGAYVWNNPETWEGGLGDWQVDAGIWEIGAPVTNPVGPNKAHQGANCAGTVLAGYYPGGQESRLISPSFVVPVAQLNPRLRFWHWYSFAGTTVGGRVQIREGAGDWVSISPEYSQNGGDVWTRPLIDLSAYAGKTVQLAFHFTAPAAGGFIDAGWYVDEVTVETGSFSLNNPETWEGGLGDWQVDAGIWEIGVPATVGPDQAHQGVNCAGTVLAGNYPDGQGSRLISPSFVVPVAQLNPRLRFWHWYSFAGTAGGGRVQIREGAGDWVSISPEYAQSSGGIWTRPLIDLSAYAGKTVQLAFSFTAPPAGGNIGAGWYVDEIQLTHDFGLVLLDPPVFRTQTTGCISLGIAASSPASTVSFTFQSPAGRLSNPILTTQGCWSGTVTPQSDSEWNVTLQSSCPEAPMGMTSVGSICFTGVSTESAFVPLTAKNLTVTNLDNSRPPIVRGVGGRAVLIAVQPLLDAWLDADGQRKANLYGIGGRTYEVRSAFELPPASPWIPGWTYTMPPSLVQDIPLTGIYSSAPGLYLRANEQ